MGLSGKKQGRYVQHITRKPHRSKRLLHYWAAAL